jgi:hypothetical protein
MVQNYQKEQLGCHIIELKKFDSVLGILCYDISEHNNVS